MDDLRHVSSNLQRLPETLSGNGIGAAHGRGVPPRRIDAANARRPHKAAARSLRKRYRARQPRSLTKTHRDSLNCVTFPRTRFAQAKSSRIRRAGVGAGERCGGGPTPLYFSFCRKDLPCRQRFPDRLARSVTMEDARDLGHETASRSRRARGGSRPDCHDSSNSATATLQLFEIPSG